MADFVVPRPAATVLTLRDSDNGYEILMLRRNVLSDFMGGAYVFPGGAVDEEDAFDDLAFRIQRRGRLRATRAFTRAAASRTTLRRFESCLKRPGCSSPAPTEASLCAFTERSDLERLAEQRRALNAGELRFVDMMHEEGLRVDLRGVAYLAHWVTPVGPPRRYDTRFFVALAPSGQRATHDAGETVADRWVRPVDALAAHARGEFTMMPPTVRNLESVAHFPQAQDVLAYARSLGPVAAVRPRIVVRDGAPVILLPGDEGFDDNES